MIFVRPCRLRGTRQAQKRVDRLAAGAFHGATLVTESHSGIHASQRLPQAETALAWVYTVWILEILVGVV